MRRAKKYHTITDIVGTVYCEQKVIFDRERGDRSDTRHGL